ncbi:eukaryotic translation initiation factor 4B2 [Prosopis cineraria]|uniref:eukaryotic translation initiation factor 4B2 n=1 Tax=Prosopis cineraria TaxID=364024 RepID=UPI00241047D8|nr:eukaryotic translation initiation factor 4B2 [Prosopis cineraria]
MSKPWGRAGDWAAEAERAEAEEREAAAAAAATGSQNFPSLKEAVNAKPKKKKMSLSEFNSFSSAAGGGIATEYKGLTPDEMLRLPTGPKDRSTDEMPYNRGFSSFGRSGPPQGRMRDRDDNDGSWGGGRRSYGGFDEERRGPTSRVSDYDQPSRADEVDNWASVKKSLPSFDSGRQNRYGSLGGGSRADEKDNWSVGKTPLRARSSTFGTGFRDSGMEPDHWTRGPSRDSERERRRLILDPPKGNAPVNEPVKTNKTNPFGAAKPREEVLAEKGVDWKKVDFEIEAKKTSRPSSSHSIRPSSSQSSRSEDTGLQETENMVKPRPKVNPFGDAKPRELLLQERGKDWRKIDLELEHRGVDRPETREEKLLKEEIDNLKKLDKQSTVNSSKESVEEVGGDQTSLQEILLQKERELESLIRDLDDKVRFGQKAIERPGSGAGRPGSSVGRPGSGAGRPGSGVGRAAGFPDRPHSQSGSFEDSRSLEFTDRPPSRGTGDVWTRPDDRRPFQGARDRGFPNSRVLDRSRSRERW